MINQLFNIFSPGGTHGALTTLIFHRVLEVPDPIFPDEPDAARFDQIMNWVKAWFNVLPLDVAVNALKCGNLPPRAAAITFDDGYADNCSVALPILKKHGLPATFFIATSFLDGGRMWNDTVIESVRKSSQGSIDCCRLGLGILSVDSIEDKRTTLARLIPALKHLPNQARADAVAYVAECCAATLPDDLMLSTSELRSLRAAGMGIGAHTVSHPILARIDAKQAQFEIAESRSTLEAVLGEHISIFAYPNGKLGSDYLPEHVALVKRLGFDAALSTNWGVSSVGDDCFQIRRFTPWDRSQWRYALRLLNNLRRGAAERNVTSHAA